MGEITPQSSALGILIVTTKEINGEVDSLDDKTKDPAKVREAGLLG
jgi:hypothetical protein